MGYNWYQWHPMVGAWDWEKSRQRYEAEATFQPIAIFIGTMMIYRWIRGTVFQAFLEFSPWWLSCLNVGVPWGFVRTLVFHGLKLLQSQGPLLVNSTKNRAIILAQKSCNKIQPWTPSIGGPCGKWTNTWRNILGRCVYWKPSLRFSKCHCCLVTIGGFTTHFFSGLS